jgi:multicomponent Na+:H+ antiporter subunit E
MPPDAAAQTHTQPGPPPAGPPAMHWSAPLLAVAGRFVVFLFLWWLLTGGRTDAWLFGAGSAAAAAVLPLLVEGPAATPARSALLPTLLRLPLLVPLFLWESLKGGVDVSLLALRPRMPLAPALLDYPLRLSPGPAPVLLASLVSLMPGTLAVIDGDRLRVHVLDATRSYDDDLARLERRVAQVFGIKLNGAPS